jgi:hypothetical protein
MVVYGVAATALAGIVAIWYIWSRLLKKPETPPT